MTSDSSAATTAVAARTLPWSQVVRGGAEPELVFTSSVLSEQNLVVTDQSTEMEPPPPVETAEEAVVVESQSDGNASVVVKSAWNKQPSSSSLVPNGGVVIGGASSWPALSESLSKSSESYGSSSVSVSQAPVITQPSPKSVKSNTSHHSNQNHARPAWQKSMKKGGGGGAGSGYNQPPPSLPPPPPPMPPYPLFDLSHGGFVPAVLDSGVREQSPYNGSNFVPRPMASAGSHSRPPHDQPSNRKRNNFGPRPRGEGGSYVNNGHGGRRDQHDRDWRGPRSHGVMPHQGAPPPPPPPRGYVPQPHLGPASFIAPQPIRPFGAPMGYDMPPPFVYVPALPPESYRGAPILPRAPPRPMYIPVMEPPLSVLIQHQIEYYFSDANLVKDNYLRSNMDEEGWVPVSLIAGFRRLLYQKRCFCVMCMSFDMPFTYRWQYGVSLGGPDNKPKWVGGRRVNVQNLTSDIQMILSCLRDSAVVEVQGETVRRRNDWAKWVQPSTNTNILAESSSQSSHADPDGSVIETSLQKLVLDESKTVQENTIDTNDTQSKEEALNIYSSGLTDSLEVANGEVTNGDQSMNAKSSTSS